MSHLQLSADHHHRMHQIAKGAHAPWTPENDASVLARKCCIKTLETARHQMFCSCEPSASPYKKKHASHAKRTRASLMGLCPDQAWHHQ